MSLPYYRNAFVIYCIVHKLCTPLQRALCFHSRQQQPSANSRPPQVNPKQKGPIGTDLKTHQVQQPQSLPGSFCPRGEVTRSGRKTRRWWTAQTRWCGSNHPAPCSLDMFVNAPYSFVNPWCLLSHVGALSPDEMLEESTKTSVHYSRLPHLEHVSSNIDQPELVTRSF